MLTLSQLKKRVRSLVPERLRPGLMALITGVLAWFLVPYYRKRLPPLVIRPGTRDLAVFKQIFVLGEYSLPIKDLAPKFIIDGGANIGFASLWFAHHYPDAKIFAIEPEQSNVESIKINTQNFPNIKTFQAGLWSKNSFLRIIDRGKGHWGFMTKEFEDPEDGDIQGITISSLLQQSDFSEIDILKLDIEGAERELFLEDHKNWLPAVNILIIELHDRIIPDCSKVFFEAISKYNFRIIHQGENLILIKEYQQST